jgi:hypothetical protein
MSSTIFRSRSKYRGVNYSIEGASALPVLSAHIFFAIFSFQTCLTFVLSLVLGSSLHFHNTILAWLVFCIILFSQWCPKVFNSSTLCPNSSGTNIHRLQHYRAPQSLDEWSEVSNFLYKLICWHSIILYEVRSSWGHMTYTCLVLSVIMCSSSGWINV